MPEPLTLYGELRVPAILLPTCQPADVEHLLHDAGRLPPDWDLVAFEAANPCGHTPP